MPLHKDFGLILADRAAWYRARRVAIEDYIVGSGLPFTSKGGLDAGSVLVPCSSDKYAKLRQLVLDDDEQARTLIPKSDPQVSSSTGNVPVICVGHVWNALCLSPSEGFGDEFNLSNTSDYQAGFSPSWELFLFACQSVAEQQGKKAFDLDFRTSETLSSFVLEVWFSKILDQGIWALSVQSPKEIWKSRFGDLLDIRQLVCDYIRELDYAIRLAAKVLGDRYRRSPTDYGGPSYDAVAFRTWYATGVLCQSERSGLAPLRVPARTSVRGDWYLAVGRGSRSLQLGERAIEKLVSTSMNSRRLREGVGLPVRSVSSFQNVETAMTTPDPELGTDRRVRFRDIHSIQPLRFDQQEGEFMPRSTALFRSCIADYDQRASEFYRMILELLRLVCPLTYEDNNGSSRRSSA